MEHDYVDEMSKVICKFEAENRQLRARIAELEAEVQATASVKLEAMLTMAEKVEGLEAELAACREDAERLNWLSSIDASKCILSCGKRWYWRKGYSQPHHRVETLREAIDKARSNHATQET